MSPHGQQVERLADGWVRFTPVPAVPGYAVVVRVARDADDRPVLGGLRVEPTDDDAPRLTERLLRSLPLADLVRRAAVLSAGPVRTYPSWRALARALGPATERPYGGSAEFSREVLQVWDEARASGLGGTAAICQRWAVSEDTARRWLREAREQR